MLLSVLLVELDTQSLAVVAATFANAGINPLTNDPVFTPATVRHCLSLMSSRGMYDYSNSRSPSACRPRAGSRAV